MKHTLKHSVVLDKAKCCGCTTCVKVCPTEAIRVSRGKAVIYADRCIDCGRCVTICPHHAKTIRSDTLDRLQDYDYNIALADTPLYGQFSNLDDLNIVDEGLRRLGFDDVYQTALGSEMLAGHWQEIDHCNPLWDGPLPRISSECPAVVRLITMEYPELIPQLIPCLCSFEVAAIVARREAAEKTGLPPERIGIGLISPCPAKNSRVYNPIGAKEPVVDYVLPMSDIYVKLLDPMREVETPRERAKVGALGMSWAITGGQCKTLPNRVGLAVDGLENVQNILSELEDDKVEDTAFVEASICTQSCFGGILTVVNPYTGKLRMRKAAAQVDAGRTAMPDWVLEKLDWTEELEETDTEIADSLPQALQLEAAAEALYRTLPKLDCGSCGAPNCRAFARDVAEGFADEGDCIFNIIKAMRRGHDHSDELDEFVPPPFRNPIK